MDIKKLNEIRDWFKANVEGEPDPDYVESIHSQDEIISEHLEGLLELAREALVARSRQEPGPSRPFKAPSPCVSHATGSLALEHLSQAADLLKLSDADRATLAEVVERRMGMPSSKSRFEGPKHGEGF